MSFMCFVNICYEFSQKYEITDDLVSVCLFNGWIETTTRLKGTKLDYIIKIRDAGAQNQSEVTGVYL